MDPREILNKIREAIPDPHRSGVAAAIRKQLGLPADVDPLDPSNWPLPVYGLNRQSGNAYQLPLVIFDDEENIKAEITVPVTPFTGDRKEGIKAIIDALPAGSNLLGAVKIRDTDSGIDVDIDPVSGSNAMRVAQAGTWTVGFVAGTKFIIDALYTDSDKMENTDSVYGSPLFNVPQNFNGVLGPQVVLDPTVPTPSGILEGVPMMINYIHVWTEDANTIYFDSDDGTLVTPTMYLPAGGQSKIGGANKLLLKIDLDIKTQLRVTTTVNTHIGVMVQGNYV